MAFVDVTLGDSAGLAVLHHVRALAPSVTVFALTHADRLDSGSAGRGARRCGGAGQADLRRRALNALSDVRTRIGERLERADLLRAARSAARGASLSGDIAEIASAKSRREAAQRIAQVIAAGRAPSRWSCTCRPPKVRASCCAQRCSAKSSRRRRFARRWKR